ncbi:MAG TPA: DNA recombination protein RmuC [Bacteroidetes bacterium]|nr:DNA recombination protein RmuC [Bacteroidota bacterium]
MEYNYVLMISIGVVGLLLGIFLAYFIFKTTTISRKTYDDLKEEHNTAKNSLVTKNAIEQELRETISKQDAELKGLMEKNNDLDHQLTRYSVEMNSLNSKYDDLVNEKDKLNEQIKENNQVVLNLKEELISVKTVNKNLNEKLELKDKEFEEARKKSLYEFENIANKLFEEKTTRFSKESKENLEQVLKPLKENLSEFKKKVEETYDKESKERFSLESKIKELVQLNQRISKEANDLTNALKGSAKTQGNWGEMILENILEHSGLVKNREYFVQDSFVDDKGNRKQPDVKIKYPDERYIIIDSKVSLTAYERYSNSDDPEQQKLFLGQHVKSMKNHIDNLSSKEYEKFDKSLDFVMLFVPIEPAYLTALQSEPDLWNYAYKKRILLISPTNLIAALKLVADIWKRDNQSKNAIAIANRGEKLYEKFVGFVSDMEELGKFIGKTSGKFDDAMKKLSTGSGNLIGQADKLKKLGVSSKKELPSKYLDNDDVNGSNK